MSRPDEVKSGEGGLRTPYYVSDSYADGGTVVRDRSGYAVAERLTAEDAAAIVRVLNSHDALVAAVTQARTAFASIANGIPAHEKYAHKCALSMDDVLAALSQARAGDA